MDYDKSKRIILKALERAKNKNITENRIKYSDKMKERMHPQLEEELRDRKTSLGNHPIFPEGDESHFEEKIMGKRFDEVVGRVKRNFDMDTVDNNFIRKNMFGLVGECIKLESTHKKELEELAEKMIREEYDMSKDDVDLIVELTPNINMEGTQKNAKPIEINEMKFENHKSIEDVNAEVYKRRFINSMIQGSAKKSSHMFHMKEDELMKMDPRLPNKYGKMMSAADYMYYIEPKMHDQNAGSVSGGVVRVIFPKKEGDKPLIHAQAMVFPVLIHELVKGVMELLSSHGLPEDNQMKEYVIGKSDYLAAEPWDMRIGPAVWERFTESIEPEDFNLKHHVYSDLVKLPVKEFNNIMREIMAGTEAGKDAVKKIILEVKNDLKTEEFNEAINIKRTSYNDFIENPDELDDIDLSDFGIK